MTGPRPPCSDQEKSAVERSAARLAGLGYETSVESFPSRASPHPWLAAYAALSSFSAVMIYPAPLLAALLGVAALVLHARDSDGRPLVRGWGRVSHNAVGRTPGIARPDLVVVAHADSAPPGSPSGIGERTVRSIALALHVFMLVIPAAGATAWVVESETELPRTVAVAGALTSFAVLGLVALLHRGPGATDAADQDEVLDLWFSLAAELRGEPVWLLVTGSKEAGMLGTQAFLEAHSRATGAASWLNLEPGRNPGVVAVSEEGVWRERRSDRGLLGAAEEAGADVIPFRTAPTNATALLARKRRALTLRLDRGPDALPVALAVARAALRDPPG